MRAVKLVALYDRARQGHPAHSEYIYKAIFSCQPLEHLAPRASGETDAADFFDADALPELSVGRTTHAQIARVLATTLIHRSRQNLTEPPTRATASTPPHHGKSHGTRPAHVTKRRPTRRRRARATDDQREQTRTSGLASPIRSETRSLASLTPAFSYGLKRSGVGRRGAPRTGWTEPRARLVRRGCCSIGEGATEPR